MTSNEEIELEILIGHKKSKTRYMTQKEQDRYKALMSKKFGSDALKFEFLQTFSK